MITEYKTFLNPKKVYLPLTDIDSKIPSVSVEVGDKVLVGQIVANKYKGKIVTPILSTVSGTVVEFIDKVDRFGKIVDHIVIENDMLNETVELFGFEDKFAIPQDRNFVHNVTTYSENISTAQVRRVLKRLGIQKVTVDGLYTDIIFSATSKHVVVNAVFTNEPFISTDCDEIINNAEAFADGISLLGIGAAADTLTVIVDKFMPGEALEALGKAIVDKNIELVSIDIKKIKSWDYKIIQKLVKHKLSNNLLDDGVIYTSLQAALMVHNAIRKGLPVINRQVAITGDALKVNAVYDVRIGTPFTDLVDDLDGYQDAEKLNLHIGSFLTGTQLNSDKFAITQSVDAINVSEYRNVEEDVCIKCGDCNDICPAGILPQNIMDAELRSVNTRIVELDTHLCVECGLCTYVCPSKINVLEWVRRAKRRVG
jgi:electron transport complex protein RnfC